MPNKKLNVVELYAGTARSADAFRAWKRCRTSLLVDSHAFAAKVYLENHPGAPYLVGSLDRKSTRLNSSHGYISYAVFCLKKKKPLARARRVLSRGRSVEGHMAEIQAQSNLVCIRLLEKQIHPDIMDQSKQITVRVVSC